jgi:hypothetical protein
VALHVWSAVSSYEVLGDFGKSWLPNYADNLRMAVFGFLLNRTYTFAARLYGDLQILKQPGTEYGRSSVLWIVVD